jgi:hypothetical protein
MYIVQETNKLAVIDKHGTSHFQEPYTSVFTKLIPLFTILQSRQWLPCSWVNQNWIQQLQRF